MNPALATSVSRHALGWLVAANVVGVWLAALLVWPELNGLTGALSYGRWMPLHLDWQLYGWCTLPLLGALAAWMIPADDLAGVRQARWALAAWSLALALGGVSWLAGNVSGKLFLDWSGWARPLLPLAMLLWWSALGAAVWARRGTLTRSELAVRAIVLALLVSVPPLLYWSEGREVYPSVNPDSGGATGASLLGSTLSLVLLIGWIPRALGLARKERGTRGARFWGALVVSAVIFVAIDRGNASHHAWAQIAALGTLLAWAPLTWGYLRGFVWPAAAGRWLGAAFAWWTLLLASGWLTFWPGLSERFKFSNVLVAHAHLAMAGAVTSFGVALLAALGRAPGGGAVAFWGWQLTTLAHVAVLVCLGILETARAGEFFVGAPWVTGLLVARLMAGSAMLAASAAWCREAKA